MDNNKIYFTSGEFAKLHKINKRTLHYYDEIGLFSPKYKGENGYRYYTYFQSIDLQRILSLRELGVSIENIKSYILNPNSKDFKELTDKKIIEIDETIRKLKSLKSNLLQKRKMLNLSENIKDGQIEIVESDEEYMLLTKVKIDFEKDEDSLNNSELLMNHFLKANELCNFKKGFGSFLSCEKILNGEMDEYDGVFTNISKKKKGLYVRPKGKYIRAFCVGSWDKVPLLYNKILEFAKKNNLKLCGYAYEFGINEFAISNLDEYVTQIEIMCEKEN